MYRLPKEKAPIILGGTRKGFFRDRNGNYIELSYKLQVALQHLPVKEVRNEVSRLL